MFTADQTNGPQRWLDEADVCGTDAADELTLCLDEPADAYERAVQALRDVRHLLPPEGVAIVDAALESAA